MTGPRQKPPAGRDKTAPSDPRLLALDLLKTVLRRGQAFDESFNAHEGLSRLEKRDRAFAHLLVATVLRRLGQLDDVIAACLDKPQEIKADLRDILRLGSAQLLFLKTPPHAAVDTMVELAGRANATAPYKGLVNAVLRRLAREGEALLAAQDAARLNTPDWLWLNWRKAWGVPQARALATAHLGEAPVDISVVKDPAGWAEKLAARLLPTGSLRLPPESPGVTELPGFEEGAWWVQDAAAALPVLLLGEVKGKRVLDLCAAPGGKTAQLLARGAVVTAVERSAPRAQRLRGNLARLRLSAEIVEEDALRFKPEAKFPFVLLDAPCTATGTTRRHPDVTRLKTPEDMERLCALQARLLDHAVTRLLAPGGKLVYAVCSLQPEEGERQIEALLERHPGLRREPLAPTELNGCADLITADGNLRCFPHLQFPGADGGMDGFFAARLALGEA